MVKQSSVLLYENEVALVWYQNHTLLWIIKNISQTKGFFRGKHPFFKLLQGQNNILCNSFWPFLAGCHAIRIYIEFIQWVCFCSNLVEKYDAAARSHNFRSTEFVLLTPELPVTAPLPPSATKSMTPYSCYELMSIELYLLHTHTHTHTHTHIHTSALPEAFNPCYIPPICILKRERRTVELLTVIFYPSHPFFSCCLYSL